MSQIVEMGLLEEGEGQAENTGNDHQPNLSEIDKKLFALAKGEQLDQVDEENHLHPGVSELIERGANVNAQDERKKTALHYVVEPVRPERKDLVCDLLYANAEFLPDQEGKTPIHQAIAAGADAVASIMIRAACNRWQTSQLSSSQQVHRTNEESFLRDLVKKELFNLVEKSNMNETALAMLDFLAEHKQYASLLDETLVRSGSCWINCDVTPFQQIALLGNTELTTHRVVKERVEDKWSKFRTIFYFGAFMNLLSTAFFMIGSSLAIITFDPDNVKGSYATAKIFLELYFLAFYIQHSTCKMYQILRYKRMYLHDRWNILEICTTISMSVLISLRIGKPQENHLMAQSFVYLLLTTRMFQYYAVNKNLLTYLNVMWNMAGKFVEFFFIWATIYVVFIGTFILTLPHYNEDGTIDHIFNRNDTIANPTSVLKRVSVFVLTTILNDEPTEKFFTEVDVGHTIAVWQILILIAYLLVTIVILLAVLVAQITNQYAVAEEEATIYFHCSRARIVTSIELSPHLLIALHMKCLRRIEACLSCIWSKACKFCKIVFGGFRRTRHHTGKQKHQDELRHLMQQVCEIRVMAEESQQTASSTLTRKKRRFVNNLMQQPTFREETPSIYQQHGNCV